MSDRIERVLEPIRVGPRHYRTRWRLLLASDMLNHSDARVSDVELCVGYDAGDAISCAFNVQYGVRTRYGGGERASLSSLFASTSQHH